MKRASYREGVWWIALNDEYGVDVETNPEAERNVASYISTALLADLFDVTTERVAKDVMAARRKARIATESPHRTGAAR